MPHTIDYLIDMVKNATILTQQKTHADVSVTAPAIPGVYNVGLTIDASYSSPTITGLLTFLVDGVPMKSKYIFGQSSLDMGRLGYQTASPNLSISATLPDGGVDIIGNIIMTYYTTVP